MKLPIINLYSVAVALLSVATSLPNCTLEVSARKRTLVRLSPLRARRHGQDRNDGLEGNTLQLRIPNVRRNNHPRCTNVPHPHPLPTNGRGNQTHLSSLSERRALRATIAMTTVVI